jgi:hypothetical protein
MKKFLAICGILFLLLIFGKLFALRHPGTPGIINPSNLVPPKVSVHH